jgi:ABC-type multidrug transport system ATPase subunit
MQILAGLVLPTSGKYLVNGLDIAEMSFEEFLPYRLAIGYGFDHGGLLHNRTMQENLMLPLLYHKILGFKKAEARVHEYMDLLNIIKYKDIRPSHVSGGTRKLVCLIRALILHPHLLLLDEPTVGLSQETSLKFFDLVEKIRQQGFLKSVFVSTHDDKTMSVVPHKKIFIEQGKILDQHFEQDRGVAV